VVNFAIPAHGLAIVTFDGRVVHSMSTQSLQLMLPDVAPGESEVQPIDRLDLAIGAHLCRPWVAVLCCAKPHPSPLHLPL
jgi:hypothetical protein